MRITNDKSLQKLHALTLMYTWKRLVSSPMTVTKLLIYFRFISTYSVDKCKYVFLIWTNELPLLSISRNCAHIRIPLTFLTTWEIFREDFSRSFFFFFPFFIYFLNFRYTKTFLSVSKLEEYDGTVQPKKEKREKKKKSTISIKPVNLPRNLPH